MSEINLNIGTTDKEYRENTLKAYICAVLDCPINEFDSIKQGIKNQKDKQVFIDMIMKDIEGGLDNILG